MEVGLDDLCGSLPPRPVRDHGVYLAILLLSVFLTLRIAVMLALIR